MQAMDASRIRRRIKGALASGIATAREQGLTQRFARETHQPLILGYHRVVEDYERVARTTIPSMLISVAMLERHLDRIGRDFEFVGLDEIGRHLDEGKPFTRPVAAVTFDDGYSDFYEHAAPLLRRKGIPAAVFVVTDLVGESAWMVHDKLYHLVTKAFATWPHPERRLFDLLDDLDVPVAGVRHAGGMRSPMDAVSALLPGLPLSDIRNVMAGIEASVGNGFVDKPRILSWPMVSELHRAGFTIGSHTRRHVSLPVEPPESAMAELVESKRVLEDRLGEPVLHFAYPGGQFTPAAVDAVAAAGYRFAYTACHHGDSRHAPLTQQRLILWEHSSVDAGGRFLPSLLDCQTHDLWPPSRTCHRVHQP
jgi:peptidoglycan/xylan/chitin deacetylase (PgdA/CDA1 family)